ncbi:molybdopterin cofactor-binding domain-containing protein [Cupriavidus basilensis]
MTRVTTSPQFHGAVLAACGDGDGAQGTGQPAAPQAPRDSGGSFGVKQAVFPYAVLMCLASRKAGAPVKWVEDRLEHLSAATSATARLSTLEAAVESRRPHQSAGL